MAAEEAKVLRDYEQVLTDLTFNSRPLITHLTIAAEQYSGRRQLAKKIVAAIQKRIYEVASNHKLPLLYLMDSILKNIGGVYLEVFCESIVEIFCHCFERMTEPDERKSLFKVRQTWTPVIPNQKLAAIDNHVHAIDPNWPVQAIAAPTIFLNPKFLASGANKDTSKGSGEVKGSPSNSAPKRKSPSPSNTNAVIKKSRKRSPMPPPTSGAAVPPPSREPIERKGGERSAAESIQSQHDTPDTLAPTSASTHPVDSPEPSIAERRKRLLEQQRLKKVERKKAMGLSKGQAPSPPVPPSTSSSSPPTTEDPRRLTGKSVQRTLTPPVGDRKTNKRVQRTLTPPVGDKKSGRRRSVSPRTRSQPASRGPSPLALLGEGGCGKTANHVDAVAKPELDIRQLESLLESLPPVEKRSRMEEGLGGEEEEVEPIKQATLDLDDLPPELLPKHHEKVLRKIEQQLASGKLSANQHGTLVQQLDRLYALQRRKEAEKKGSEPPPNQTSLAPPSQTSLAPPSHNQTSLAPPPSQTSLAPPPSQTSFAPPPRQTPLAQPPNQTSLAPPPNQTSLAPPFSDARRSPPPFTDAPPPVETVPGERFGPPRGNFRPRPPRSIHRLPPHRPPPRERIPRRGRPPRSRYPRRRPPREYFNRPHPNWEEPPAPCGPPPGHAHPPLQYPPPPPPPHWEPRDGEGRLGPDHPAHLPDGPPHPPSTAPQPPPPSVHVSQLFSKLVEVGMITGGGQREGGGGSERGEGERERRSPASQEPGPPEHPPRQVPRLSLTVATLKQRYTAMISLIHSGEQCNSCGLRFASRSSPEYRSHLDWHYRVNHKESEGIKKVSRNWFMHPEVWMTYEESSVDSEDKDPPSLVADLPDEPEEDRGQGRREEELSSCKVLPGEGNEVCTLCQEPFEQFWEEDEEEWHFEDAMRSADGRLYHKACHEDAQKAGDLTISQPPSPMDTDGIDSNQTFGDLLKP